MKNFFLVILALFTTTCLFAKDSNCTRTIEVNNKHLLLDFGPYKKGEGLRPFIMNNQEALQYLDRYQNFEKQRKLSVAGNLLGFSSFIYGLSSSNNKKIFGVKRQTFFLISGIGTIFASFLIRKSFRLKNEFNLHKAIEIHNRNSKTTIEFEHP